MKKTILLALFVLAPLFGARSAHATNASPSIITSTSTTSPISGAFLAAPAAGYYNLLNGCVFSNGYSAGECVTVSSSVSGEPSFEMCAPSSSTVFSPGGLANSNGRASSGFNSLFGVNLAYSGALTVTGTATQANILLTCGYRTSNGLQ